MEPPMKFEAGTPAIVPVIGLGAALDYLQALGWERITGYEKALLAYAEQKLAGIDRLTKIGTAEEKAGLISFTLEGIHPHDLGTILDQDGIAIRTGNHCAQPVMQRFQVPATARASFSFYNTFREIDLLAEALAKSRRIFG
jgi:cysteine desulfurase/selenocysteine lyase